MNPPAKLSDLILALDMPSEEFRTYFDRKTGSFVSDEETMLSRLEDGEEQDPDDLAEWQKEEYEAAKEIVSDEGEDLPSFRRWIRRDSAQAERWLIL